MSCRSFLCFRSECFRCSLNDLLHWNDRFNNRKGNFQSWLRKIGTFNQSQCAHFLIIYCNFLFNNCSRHRCTIFSFLRYSLFFVKRNKKEKLRIWRRIASQRQPLLSLRHDWLCLYFSSPWLPTIWKRRRVVGSFSDVGSVLQRILKYREWYIFFYVMGNFPSIEKWQREFGKKLSLDLRKVWERNVTGNRNIFEIENVRLCGKGKQIMVRVPSTMARGCTWTSPAASNK